MSANSGCARYAPSAVLGTAGTIVAGFAVNGLSPDPWKWSWWWLALVLGAVGTVASALWVVVLQSKSSGDRSGSALQSATADQQIAKGNRIDMRVGEGGIAAVNISGGITMSPRSNDGPHPR